MSVPDRTSAIARRTIEEAKVEAYRDYFCEVFAKIAPEAFADLMTNVESASVMTRAVPQNTPTLARSVQRAFMIKMHAWAERYHIDAPWVINAASLTVGSAALVDRQEQQNERDAAASERFPRPTTLIRYASNVRLRDRFHREFNLLDEMELQIVTEFRIDLKRDAFQFVWDPTTERAGDFKKRAKEAFNVALDDAVRQVQAVSGPRPLVVDRPGVEWLIRKRVNGETVYAIAKTYRHGDQNKTVREAIRRAEDILGIPEPDDK